MGGKLAIDVTKAPGTPEVSVVRVEGFLDAATARELSQRAGPLVNKPRPLIVVDLGALEYLGSAGVAALMDLAYNSQDNRGEIALANPPGKIREVLKTLGLTEVLSIRGSLDEAVAALRNGVASPSVASRAEAAAQTPTVKSVEFVRPGETAGAGTVVSKSPGLTIAMPGIPTPLGPSPAPVSAPVTPSSVSNAPQAPPRTGETPITGNTLRELAQVQLDLAQELAKLLERNAEQLSSVRAAADRLRAILDRLPRT